MTDDGELNKFAWKARIRSPPPDMEDMEDINTDEIEIAYAESICSPAKGWLQ